MGVIGRAGRSRSRVLPRRMAHHLRNARAVGRAEETVRKRYRPPLLERGELKRRHPDIPRYPFQAYRTAKKEPCAEAEKKTA